MPFTADDTKLYRRDVSKNGQLLSAEEREALLKKYLPSPSQLGKSLSTSNRSTRSTPTSGHKPRIRPYLRSLLHLAIHLIIQFVFGIYIRIRQILNACIQKFLSIRHYHHRTPAYIQRDTQSLSRIPQHLSILLRYDHLSDDSAGLEVLVDEVAELCAWSTAAGIPLLSIYEKTGILKTYISAVQALVHQKLVQYFGSHPHTPTLRVHAPNLPALAPIPNPIPTTTSSPSSSNQPPKPPHLDLLLLSAADGRDTLVDLTRTLTEMSQSHKLLPKDITSSLVNTEINATTSLPPSFSPSPTPTSPTTMSPTHRIQKTTPDSSPSEPDLLLVFAPYVKLDAYPPWQTRLTEIYCVGDSGGDVRSGGAGWSKGRTRVEYQGFLRGLWKYAGAEMRFGR